MNQEQTPALEELLKKQGWLMSMVARLPDETEIEFTQGGVNNVTVSSVASAATVECRPAVKPALKIQLTADAIRYLQSNEISGWLHLSEFLAKALTAGWIQLRLGQVDQVLKLDQIQGWIAGQAFAKMQSINAIVSKFKKGKKSRKRKDHET